MPMIDFNQKQVMVQHNGYIADNIEIARHVANYLIDHPTDLARRFTLYGNRAQPSLLMTLADYEELKDARSEVNESLQVAILNDRTRHHAMTTRLYLDIILKWFQEEYIRVDPKFIFELLKD